VSFFENIVVLQVYQLVRKQSFFDFKFYGAGIVGCNFNVTNKWILCESQHAFQNLDVCKARRKLVELSQIGAVKAWGE